MNEWSWFSAQPVLLSSLKMEGDVSQQTSDHPIIVERPAKDRSRKQDRPFVLWWKASGKHLHRHFMPEWVRFGRYKTMDQAELVARKKRAQFVSWLFVVTDGSRPD